VDWPLLRLTLTILLTSLTANSFGTPLSQVTVCTIFSLLKPPPTVLISFVKGNIHICFPLFIIHSLKTLVSIVVYLNMYNRLIVILCFFFLISSYCTFYALYFRFCAFCVFHWNSLCNSVRLSYWILTYLLTFIVLLLMLSIIRNRSHCGNFTVSWKSELVTYDEFTVLHWTIDWLIWSIDYLFRCISHGCWE